MRDISMERVNETRKNILEIKDFQIQELSGGLFRISCQTSDGTEQSVILSERSAS